jgi:uncharacterized repeat protein (TIGR03943 family)
MSSRTQRALQALLLAALGLFFLEKIWNGSLYWYINQRFMFLTALAGAGLLALASLTLPTRQKTNDPAPDHDHVHDPDHPHDHAHSAVSWGGLTIVAIPLLLGALIPAKPLGSAAVANKGINETAPLAGGDSKPMQLEMASTERNVLDWVRAFNYADDATVYSGQAADVVGFVYHDGRLGADQFLASRFAVACCSADATAVGLVVQWPEAAKLADNGWVRVRGAMGVTTFAGRSTPLLTADSVEGVEAPAQPYLYP